MLLTSDRYNDNKLDIDKAFWTLEKYILSWQREDGAVAGIIATFWDWTLDTIEPHTMTHYPLILGYLNLFNKFNNPIYIEKAKKIANFYLTHQSKNGFFTNSWADIPPKHSGLILQICPDIALLELYKITNDKIYLDVVNNNIEWLFHNWWLKNGFQGYVVNQTCKAIEAFLLLFDITDLQKYKDLAFKLGSWVLTQQVKRPGLGKGGFYQSIHDDRLILVYNAKVVPALVRLYTLSNDLSYRLALENLTKFILNNLHKDGLFNSHLQFNLNELNRVGINSIYKVTKFIPPARQLVRQVRRNNLTYKLCHYPMWIARSADLIRSLILVNRVIDVDHSIMEKLINNLLSFQYENGGFPNTIGYFGNPQITSWQDVICSTRWNAYCFLLLSELVNQEYHLDDKFPVIHKTYQEKTKERIFIESKDCIEWREGNRIIKQFNKR